MRVVPVLDPFHQIVNRKHRHEVNGPIELEGVLSGIAPGKERTGLILEMKRRRHDVFLDVHSGRIEGHTVVLEFHCQSRGASNSNALREAHRQHTRNGRGEGNGIGLLNGVAVLELHGTEHANAGSNQNTGQCRHGDGGNARTHKSDATKYEASLNQSRQPCLGIEPRVQTRPSNHGRDGHAHEETRANVRQTLTYQLLIGIVLI
mmetsp:Transcript_23573/g.55518  ORF Transcript_23573/g.55518 Transcript_23573/m.55518 type:complete len:205 (-) Transcript_23573:862-1476(-)